MLEKVKWYTRYYDNEPCRYGQHLKQVRVLGRYGVISLTHARRRPHSSLPTSQLPFYEQAVKVFLPPARACIRDSSSGGIGLCCFSQFSEFLRTTDEHNVYVYVFRYARVHRTNASDDALKNGRSNRHNAQRQVLSQNQARAVKNMRPYWIKK